MLKKLLLVGLLALGCQAQAATVVKTSWSAGFDNGFALADGTPLAVGSEVRVGSFDIPKTEITSLIQAGNLSALAQHFSLFGTTTIGTAAPDSDLAGVQLAQRAGLFSTVTEAAITPGTSGKQIYIWVFQTTGNGAVQANFSNVLQMGVFSSSLENWNFPVDGSVVANQTVELTNLTDAAGTSLLSSAEIAYGFFGVGTNPTTGALSFNLAPVIPEPSTAIAALLGGSALLLRRRRKD